MFRPTLILAFLLLVAVPALAAHDLLLIPTDTADGESWVRDNAGWLDIVHSKPGVGVQVVADPATRTRLDRAGVSYRVLRNDMESAARYPDKGAGFGIYHTWSESVAFVDSLRLLYPQVISQKWSLGTTVEGRDIWCFRVSDNPDIDEAEPEVLLDAMHHAREIMAGEFVIMFAEYLAQNYGTDPEVTWLLDNRELYLVPMVNPDGIVYNEQTDPNGGGLWRKNRRDNGDGTFGVDLNRNYPYEWGYDDVGSSPYTGDVTYRGPSAGSEVETQVMMNFIAGRDIKTHDTIHTYSNLLLYPWGYADLATPDDAAFAAMGAAMTQYNGYVAGRPASAINYTANGGTLDWSYGVEGVISFSSEIGASSDGFWPAESRRGPLFQENIWPHLYLMRAAGPFVSVRDAVVTADAPAKAIDPGQSGTLDFTVESQSPVAGSPATALTVRTDDPWIQLLAAQSTTGALAPLAATALIPGPLPFEVEAACPPGHVVSVAVTTHLPEGDLTTPLSFVVGSPSPVFADDLEAGGGAWSLTGNWALTATDAFSGTYSLTDSPAGNYSDETLTSATLQGIWYASSLTFRHRYDIESGWDFGRVEVSADGGPWSPVATYTGTAPTWAEETVDLSAHAGSALAIRFVLDTDYSVTRDGWYIDDIALLGDPSGGFSAAPPVTAGPLGGVTTGATPALTVDNGVLPGGGTPVYGFRVYRDELCTDLAASVDGIAEGAGTTSWTTPALADGDYWWRAWIGDGTQRSDLSPAATFTVFDASPVIDGLVSGLRVLGSVGGSSRLELSVARSAPVQVDVHDARGALVRRLHTGQADSGVRVLVWDGRDRAGRTAASGVYFVRARVGAEVFTGRMVLVR